MQLSAIFYTIGKYCGLIGFTTLAFLIFSGDSARFWDRFFGLDRIIKFQRKFSLITAIFVISHPIFFLLSGLPFTSLFIPNYSILPLAFGITAFYIFLIVTIASAMYKRISYFVWQILHILIYILFGLSLYHAFNAGSDSNEWYAQLFYTITMILVIAAAIYRTQYKLRKIFAGKFTVKEIKWETYDTFSLILIPEKPLKFRAGQFCFLRLNKNNLNSRHPFTISSSPGDSDLRFTIKKAGRFTLTASELRVGEEVLIDGPFGNFVVRDESKNLVFIAGGVGITPFMSIIQNFVNLKQNPNILLLYGSKTEKDIIFKNEIESFDSKSLKTVHILSQEKNSKYENGYLSEEIVKKYVDDLQNSDFYICGPETMKNSAKKILQNLGVKSTQIFVEDFFW